MSKKLFIIGTGTEVGKTYVTGLLLKKLKENGKSAAYYKAAMSGNVRSVEGKLQPIDALTVKKMSGISQKIEEMCPYVYEAALSPHLASFLEGNPVQLSVVEEGFHKLCAKYDFITMEGSGGILCPLRFDKEKLWLEDVIRKLGFSCLLVADAGLGTINNVGLTAAYLREKKIPLKGIIFNHFHPEQEPDEDNLHMCEQLTGSKVLACVKEGDKEIEIDVKLLLSLYEDS